MTRSKIIPRLTLLLLVLLLFEVAALHLNRRPLQLVAKEIRFEKPEEQGTPARPWLVCELKNDRITPIRYFALNDEMSVYEIVSPQFNGRNNWCTPNDDHWVAPFSSVTVRFPVPGPLTGVKVSIWYTDTSLLSGLLSIAADDRRATTETDLTRLPQLK